MSGELGRDTHNRLFGTTSAKRGIETFLNFFLNCNYIFMYRVLKTKYKSRFKSTTTVPEKPTFANNQQRQLYPNNDLKL